MATVMPVTDNTIIAIKVSVNESTKKLKLPLKDLGANILPGKLRHLLCITPEQTVVFERFSDSVGGYVTLDDSNPAVFKTLMRAAKAKLKLRLKATVTPPFPEEKKEEVPHVAGVHGPVIARTPIYAPAQPDFTAFGQSAIGPNIFNFRDRITMPKVQPANTLWSPLQGEAPIPQPFTLPPCDPGSTFPLPGIADTRSPALALRTKPSIVAVNTSPTWSVYCNECDSAMDNTHFHCSICDGGDYDLCEKCVDGGKLCPGEGHWLVKRSIVDGKVISSTTERIVPKAREETASHIEVKTETQVPGAFTEDTKTLYEALEDTSNFRTCNSCVATFPEDAFITCGTCPDFDICRNCHTENKHGHHPGHQLKPAVDGMDLTLAETALLSAGRNVRHSAICDGCDKGIFGVRHKCFTCPDFDYCSECVKGARHTHPRHRFAVIYDPMPVQRVSHVRHHGVYCDGPLCKDSPNQSYIQGVRFKCVVCHDTDFCGACEALPTSFHNKTHPLVKFKTPVNHLTISTESEDRNGAVKKMGDRQAEEPVQQEPSAYVHYMPKQETIPVETVADFKPTAELKPKKSSSLELNATFVRDTVIDGTRVTPNTRFTQVWTLRNSGPNAWPAGCSVRYVGGDNMLNIDNTHASSVSDIAEATESNVIGREVQPGEEVAFKVLMKAPVRAGKAISYWRLKSADGTPFGHRLWCDIDVQNEAIKIEDSNVRAEKPDISSFKSYWAQYQEQFATAKSSTSQEHAKVEEPKTVVNEAESEAKAVEEEKAEEELKGSKMIFPTLEKESPASSTYQSMSSSGMRKARAAYVEDEASGIKVADASVCTQEASDKTAETSEDTFEDVTEELEVLSADGEAESLEDDGFMTDEEYDILDASDQETVASN